MRLCVSLGVFSALLLSPLAGPSLCASVDLRMEPLADSLKLLKSEERTAVEQAVEFIRRGENTTALARLSTLTGANPQNSSLRILSAYALLQLGNFLGAFEEAKKAEAAPNGNSYKCWFLAKVALLAGDKEVCRRELEHARKAGHLASDIKAIEKELQRN